MLLGLRIYCQPDFAYLEIDPDQRTLGLCDWLTNYSRTRSSLHDNYGLDKGCQGKLAIRNFNENNLYDLAVLILPIAICGIGLAWYNWARFGSVFEFGLRYQLTSTDYLNSGNTLFSIGNIIGKFVQLFNPYFCDHTPIFPMSRRLRTLAQTKEWLDCFSRFLIFYWDSSLQPRLSKNK